MIWQIGGGSSNGISDSRTYVFSNTEGTWGVENYNGNEGSAGSFSSSLKGSYDYMYPDTATGTALKLPAGIYQHGNANIGYGIYIGAVDTNNKPVFDFTSGGGVIWDYTAYIGSIKENEYITLSNGEKGENSTLSGGITISNGIFKGKIDIRKGNVQAGSPGVTLIGELNGEAKPLIYTVSTRGDINISGGDFYFSQDKSQIMMYQHNSGDIFVRGGNWYVGYADENTALNDVIGVEVRHYDPSGRVTITGGKYHIAEHATLTFAAINQHGTEGGSGSFSNPNSTFQIDGKGTLEFKFKSFDINSNIIWETGTLKQSGGILTIASNTNVYVDKYIGTAGVEPDRLIINGVLSVKNNLDLRFTDLAGSGELRLDETASAFMGPLSDFGELTLKRGKLTFTRGQDSESTSVRTINGASGSKGEQIGLIAVNARTIVNTLNLGNAALLMNEQLIVKDLHFDNGQIIFTASDKPLTLTDSTTIWNTSTIVTGDGTSSYTALMGKSLYYEMRSEDGTGSVLIKYKNSDGDTKQYPDDSTAVNPWLYYDSGTGKFITETELDKTFFLTPDITPTPGTLTIKDGMTLTFADVDAPDSNLYSFSSPYLDINVENTAKALFNSRWVSFKNLTITNGSAEISQSEENGLIKVLDSINLGNGGKLTVNSGSMTAQTLTSESGSTVEFGKNGKLSVGELTIRGSQSGWGTVTGGGTLEVTSSASFQGRIIDLGNLIIDGGTATFNNQTSFQDTIGTMTVKNGRVTLTHGSLILDSLTLNHGVIELAAEDSLLALTKDPSKHESISGEGNSISGIGTLELLNDTGITFGGGSGGSVGYLGELKIGTGTAKIEKVEPPAESVTVLGQVTFTSDTGGTLQINDGATLLIAAEDKTSCSRTDHCKITTLSGNTVQGAGTLRLIDGDGSVFGGKVDLNVLDLQKAGITVTFDYNQESKISTLSSAGAFNLIVNNGTLTLANDFGRADTKVSGTGRLFLQGNASSFTTGADSLERLTVGSGTVHVNGGTFGEIDFETDAAGTLNLDADITVTKKISVNAANDTEKNTITGAGKLTLYGAVGSFFTDLSSIGGLILNDGADYNRAIAYINTTTSIGGSGLTLNKGKVEIASGTALTVNNTTVGIAVAEGESPASTVTGAGTLILAGTDQTVNSSLTGLNTLQTSVTSNAVIKNDAEITNVIVDSGTALSFSKKAVLTNVDTAGTLTLNGENNVISGNTKVSNAMNLNGNNNLFSGKVEISGELNLNGDNNVISGNTEIEGRLNVNGDTRANTISFTTDSGGQVNIAQDKTLSVFNTVSVNGANVLGGTGTLFLADHASGTFSMMQDFNGTIKIGSAASALIRTNAGIGAILFENTQGGSLSIDDGYTLTVGKIITGGDNKITGAGTLRLNGEGQTSVFGAPIDDLGTLTVTNGAIAKFDNPNRKLTISKLEFAEGAGRINIANGTTITIVSLEQKDSSNIGSVYGEGAMVAGTGTVALSTGGLNQKLANATIGTGTLNFVGDSHIGSLQYSSADGTINITNDVTVQVDSSFSGIGILTGAESAKLQLTGQADATFYKAIEYKGSISAETGTLRFLSDTDFKKLSLNGTTVKFERETSVDTVEMSTGDVEFRLAANVGNLSITSSGSVLFKDTASVGTMNIGSGTVKFRADSSLSGGSVSAGGTLDLDVNKLTVNTGNFEFGNNSAFSMRISRAATDENGNVNDSGYGRIVMNGGTLNIGSNVKLNMTIDYGVQTAPDGSVFKLIEGNEYNEFVFSNNRYKLEKATCEGGLCYRLIQASSAGEYAQEESGNQNQVNTAAAFLDGELFEYGTKAFEVAEHLDAISQNGVSRKFLNALTALAPDVTGAMSHQPIALQSKIANTLSGRMIGLSGHLGSSSRTYRDIQRMYGRSGGSPYRTRFMRSSDYYRRAGYYDQYDQPVTRPRPAYRRPVAPDSVEERETVAERKRWAKRRTSYKSPKEFGVWGQTFYNMADYLSKDKPDGFSGKTTGYAFGADMQLFDVFAVGLGYASTSSTVDSLQRDTDVDGTSFFLYGMYKPSDWFISSILNVASMTYDEKKDVSGISVKDKYKGSSLGFSLMFGKELEAWTPSVGLRHISSDRKSHKDEIGQNISGISTTVTSFVAEGRMNRDFAKTDSSYLHSELSAALTYDFSAAGEDATVNLPNGSTYIVKGDDFSEIGVELGGTLSWLYGEHVDISAGYNLEWRQDYLSHTLTATFRYTF